MLFKIAKRNIRRSVKDYAIYFVTLLIAITVFYAFNSVSDQQVMHEIAESSMSDIVEFTNVMMSLFSTVVAFVLGFLVIYANQLLIRRRKREFGMYFTLGMRPGQVSRIILYETVLVGIVSLVLGLGLGVLVSQLLSFVTAALFGIPMPDYQFAFSMGAFVMTLVCFVAIYVVVALFNVVSISRCKLIDLINAESKQQKVVIRNPWVCLVLFVVSIGLLGVGYWQLELNGMVLVGDEHFTAATILMLVGTLLLFFSLAGFIIATITHVRGFFLKRLRPFTTRQIASKVNTSFASMWVVCILLFFAITTFATGMALANAFAEDIETANPYDASVVLMQSKADADTERVEMSAFDVTQADKVLREKVPDWDDMVEASAQVDVYVLPELTYGDVMAATDSSLGQEGASAGKQKVNVVGLSQLNGALALQGKDTVALAEDEYLVSNNMKAADSVARAMVENTYPLATPIGTLSPASEVIEVQLEDFSMPSNAVTLVVPDSLIAILAEQSDPLGSYVNVAFVAGSDIGKEFEQRVENADVPGVTSVFTRDAMIGQAMGLKIVVTYLALYIGLVLLIAVAAVLAIQLLSLTIDSQRRYRTLSRLGCDMRMLSRSLFSQVVIYFLLPLAVAICHAAWTIKLLSESLFDALGYDILSSILMSAGFIVLVYGGYLLITYFASRAVVKAGVEQRS